MTDDFVICPNERTISRAKVLVPRGWKCAGDCVRCEWFTKAVKNEQKKYVESPLYRELLKKGRI